MTEELGINAPIVFDVNDQAIAEVAEAFKEVDAYKDLTEAKAAKKVLTKMRTKLAEAHKAAKADALEYGRRCDAEKNRLLAMILKVEDPISEQLTEIKNAEEAKEAARVMVIGEEMDRIEAHAADRYSLTLDQLRERQENLGNIEVTEEIFQEFTERAALLKQDAGMKLDLAIKAEKDRIQEEAEKAEREEENRRLKEKVEAMEREQEEQRRKDHLKAAEEAAEAQRKADIKAEAERKAREKAEQEAREAAAEAQRLREEAEAREALEQAEREKEDAARREAEQAPDRQKLLIFADSVDDLLGAKPTLSTDPAKDIMQQATAMLIEVAYDIRKMTEEMK